MLAEKKKEKHQDFPNLWEAILIIGLLFGVEILIGSAFYDAGERYAAGDPEYGGVISVLGCGILFSLLMSYKNMSYARLFHPGERSVAATLWPLWAPLFVLTVGSVFLALKIFEFLASVFPMSNAEIEMFERMLSGGMVSVITVCVVAPFIEEMLFRGIFLRSFLVRYSPARAIVYSSLLFGAVHMNIYQFVIAAWLGMISGWLYVTTRSLWPCILEHAFYNGGVMLHYVWARPAPGTEIVQSPADGSVLVTIAGLVLFVVGGLWLRKVAERLHLEGTENKRDATLL